MRYYCRNCNSYLDSDKERKRCSKCRKSLEVTSMPIVDEEKSYFINPMAAPKSKEYRDDDGRRAPKNLPLKVKTKFITSDEHQDDKKYDKMGTFAVSKRRERVEKVEVTCSKCHRTEKIYPTLIFPNHKCDKCLNKVRPQT